MSALTDKADTLPGLDVPADAAQHLLVLKRDAHVLQLDAAADCAGARRGAVAAASASAAALPLALALAVLFPLLLRRGGGAVAEALRRGAVLLLAAGGGV